MFNFRKTRWPRGTVAFTVYGTPIGKGMPVVTKTHTFKPKATRDWETSIAGQAFQYRPDVPFNEPLLLGVLVYRPMPKYITKYPKKVAAALAYEILPAKKPDIKNLVASVEDALEGVFYINDSSIIGYINVNGLPTGKYYSEVPRIEIVIVPISSFS